MFVAVTWYFQPVFFSNSVSFFASRAEGRTRRAMSRMPVRPAGARGQVRDLRDGAGVLVKRVTVLVEHH